MLLSDPETQKLLASSVVASWEMVREVPKVTIDFGNGKKLDRTLKGNTVMYLCSPDGKVIEAWPGVYTAIDFRRQLEGTLRELREAQIDPGKPLDAAAEKRVFSFHRRAVTGFGANYDMPIALTISKMGVESPILKMLGERPQVAAEDLTPKLRGSLGNAAAQRQAPPTSDYGDLFRRYVAKLYDASESPMSAEQAKRLMSARSTSKMTPEEAGRLAVEEDSQQNSFYVRPAVHLWLASVDHLPTTAESKMTAFKSILHVPIDDPYLGLADIVPPGTPGGG